MAPSNNTELVISVKHGCRSDQFCIPIASLSNSIYVAVLIDQQARGLILARHYYTQNVMWSKSLYTTKREMSGWRCPIRRLNLDYSQGGHWPRLAQRPKHLQQAVFFEEVGHNGTLKDDRSTPASTLRELECYKWTATSKPEMICSKWEWIYVECSNSSGAGP